MRHRLRLGCLGLLVPAAALPGMLSGQEAGGRRLSVDIDQNVEAETNRSLSQNGESRVVATTDLGLSVESVTRLSSIGLSFGGAARVPLAGPGDAVFDGPTTRLDYARRGANASLSVSARYEEDEIDYLDPIDLIDLEDSEVILPEELGELEGEGTRSNVVLDLEASWGDSGPFGLTSSVTLRETRYGNGADAALEDRTGLDVDLGTRFDIRPDLQATSTLRYNLAETKAEETETYGLGLGLAYSRPAAIYTAGFAVSQAEDSDLRVGLLTGASLRLPRDSALDFELGLTRAATDETIVTGRFNYTAQPTPTDQFNVSARRSVFDDADENEIVTTTLDADYTRDLTRLTDLSLGIGLVGRNNLNANEGTTDIDFSASVSHELTRDWSLSAGVGHRIRRSDTDGNGNSERMFFAIGRSFVTKF